ncbi:hypothetical protein [Nitrospina gracilis]|nr:hypothetical protein [Nitrospina gracilis]MCF8719581.1 hypothetical protein [Nitrospina gracilis Nb-211]
MAIAWKGIVIEIGQDKREPDALQIQIVAFGFNPADLLFGVMG